MRPLILSDFGDSLKVRGYRLVVNSGRGGEFEARECPYDSVFCLTYSGMVTFEAIRWLSSQRIPVHFIAFDGRLSSSILPTLTPKGNLKLRQYRAATDPKRKKEIAEGIVEAKRQRMESLLLKIGHPRNLGIGESSAKAYWNELGKAFRGLGYPYTGRKNIDNVNFRATSIPNALLNYGYGVLVAKVRTETNLAGLDDSIGFLHRNYGWQPSMQPLPYDLMEPFRSDVDEGVIHFLETEKPAAKDFDRDRKTYQIMLWPETARRLIENLGLDQNSMRAYIRAFAKSL